jgi:hypothetical protein
LEQRVKGLQRWVKQAYKQESFGESDMEIEYENDDW